MQFIEKNTKLQSVLTNYFNCWICLLQICLEKSVSCYPENVLHMKCDVRKLLVMHTISRSDSARCGWNSGWFHVKVFTRQHDYWHFISFHSFVTDMQLRQHLILYFSSRCNILTCASEIVCYMFSHSVLLTGMFS